MLQTIGQILTMSISMPKWLFLGNMATACISGFVMNVLLLFLINKRTPKEMQSYARIMRVHCISDMLYDLIQSVSGAQAAPINGKIFTVLHGFAWQSSPKMTQINVCLYFWSLLFSMALLPIDFVYRYVSVVKNKDLTNKQLFFLVFLAYSITGEHAFINTPRFLIQGHLNETQEYTKELTKYWPEKVVPPFMITPMYTYKVIINYVFMTLLNVVVFGTIFYTYSKIRVALRQNANIMKNSRAVSIQKTVTRLLALQAILPILVNCIPIMTIVLFAILQINLPYAGAYCASVYVWIGTLKPFLTICIVPRYRQYLRMQICRDVKVSERSSALTNNMSTNHREEPPRISVVNDGMSGARRNRM